VRLVIFFLICGILLAAAELKAEEITGRIIAINAQTKEVVVKPFCQKAPEIILQKPHAFESYHPGDLVKIKIDTQGRDLKVKSIRPFSLKDRTGVRKRLKMRRRHCGCGRP